MISRKLTRNTYRSFKACLFILLTCLCCSCSNQSADAPEQAQVAALPDMVFSQSADSIEVYDFLEVQITVTSPTAKIPFTDVFGDRLTEAVNAQVRSLRDELGIPEPVVARPVEPPVAARVVRAGPNAERAILSIPLETPWNQAPSLPVSVIKRVPVWIKQVTGIARRRMP